MWIYEKKLQYPVSIARPNLRLAKVIMSQLGGPDGELAASSRYLYQRYAMPCKEAVATLTDIGTEELAHQEIVSAIIHQLTRCADEDDIDRAGMADYYVDHTLGQWPQAAAGIPFSSLMFQSKGDPLTDLHEDMAAEQKARTTYDNLIRLADDPDVIDALRFLRAREVVHYQRFGEALRIVHDKLDSRNFYAFNPAFDVSVGNGYNGNTGERIYRCGDSCEVRYTELRQPCEQRRETHCDKPCEPVCEKPTAPVYASAPRCYEAHCDQGYVFNASCDPCESGNA